MNRIIETEITSITDKAKGVSVVDGLVYFIDGCTIGDFVRAEVVKEKKNYALAKTIKILKESPYRIKENEHYCDACALSNISYEKEIEIKKNMVENNLLRIGKIDKKIDEFIPARRRYNYRNKCIYQINKKDGIAYYGTFEKNSNEVDMASKGCLIQKKEVNALADKLIKLINDYKIDIYDKRTKVKGLKSICIRMTDYEKTAQVIFIGNKRIENPKFFIKVYEMPEVDSIASCFNNKDSALSRNITILLGKHEVEEEINGIKIKVSPESFMQTNTEMAEILYSKAIEMADFGPKDKVLELYSGVGAISLNLARNVKEVLGVEIVDEATKNAELNKERNSISNASFITMNAGAIDQELISKFDILFIDPPRSGLDPNLKELLKKSNIEKIVYVSCDSATLARDINELSEKFEVKKSVAVDMFPCTAHVESIVVLGS